MTCNLLNWFLIGDLTQPILPSEYDYLKQTIFTTGLYSVSLPFSCHNQGPDIWMGFPFNGNVCVEVSRRNQYP